MTKVVAQEARQNPRL